MSYSYNSNTKPHAFYALASASATRFVGATPTGNPPPEPANCCEPCYILPALAQLTPDDPLKNDTAPIVYCGLTPSDTITFVMEKYDKITGVWNPIETISDNTYGDFKPIGSYSNPFLQSFVVDWSLVLNEFGPGFFRFKISIGGVSDYTTYSFAWCLKEYTDHAADKTVRFEWTLHDRQSDINSWRFNTDYADSYIPCMIRVEGLFGYLKAEYSDQEVEYEETGLTDNYRSETSPSYEFKSGRYYYLIHNILMHSTFPSNDLVVTDYCKRNEVQDIKRIPIQRTSGYSPGYDKDNSVLTRVTMSFKDKSWDRGRRFSK